jgi:hypothetical protein
VGLGEAVAAMLAAAAIAAAVGPELLTVLATLERSTAVPSSRVILTALARGLAGTKAADPPPGVNAGAPGENAAAPGENKLGVRGAC